MAGKRMKLKMDMPVFSCAPVDRRVLSNWSEAIHDHDALRMELKKAIHTATAETIWINFDDPRKIASVAEVVNHMVPGLPLLLRVRLAHDGDPTFHGMTQSDILGVRISDAAQPTIDKALWLLMILNTWRAMCDQMSGPLIGFNFNITIPGIVATCLRLGVAVDFEGE